MVVVVVFTCNGDVGRASLCPLSSTWASPYYLLHGDKSMSLQTPSLMEGERQRRRDKERRVRKYHFSLTAFPPTPSPTSGSVFPWLLKLAHLIQPSECLFSLSILGVPILHFDFTREIRAWLLASLDVESTQPRLCDSGCPVEHRPWSRLGLGCTFWAVFEEQVAGLPAGARRGLKFMCMHPLLVILSLLQAAFHDHFNVILPE